MRAAAFWSKALLRQPGGFEGLLLFAEVDEVGFVAPD